MIGSLMDYWRTSGQLQQTANSIIFNAFDILHTMHSQGLMRDKKSKKIYRESYFVQFVIQMARFTKILPL